MKLKMAKMIEKINENKRWFFKKDKKIESFHQTDQKREGRLPISGMKEGI